LPEIIVTSRTKYNKIDFNTNLVKVESETIPAASTEIRSITSIMSTNYIAMGTNNTRAYYAEHTQSLFTLFYTSANTRDMWTIQHIPNSNAIAIGNGNLFTV
jgi:hypothetical protein